MCVFSEEIFLEAPSVEKVEGDARGGEAGGCACGGGRAPPAPPLPAPPAPLVSQSPHPLRALEDMPPVLRSNPLYTEEEEQEVVIIVDSLEETPDSEVPEPPRVPRRAPSTSSGYGSGAGSHGRVSPTLPKNESYEPPPPPRLSDCEKNEGSHTTSDSEGSPTCTLSRSLKDDIRACLAGCRWERDVGELVEAAVRGAGGVSAARARLHAALRALHEPPARRAHALPYCGPGVRPGDVTMMPKATGISLFPIKSPLLNRGLPYGPESPASIDSLPTRREPFFPNGYQFVVLCGQPTLQRYEYFQIYKSTGSQKRNVADLH